MIASLKDCGDAAFSAAQSEVAEREAPRGETSPTGLDTAAKSEAKAVVRTTVDLVAPLICLAHFSFTYEGAAAPSLTDINLEVRPGEFVGLVGAEGSGRTTLFRVLNGSASRHFRGEWSGVAEIGGLDACEVGHATLGEFVASIFDDPDAQIVSLTVEEEVCFALVQRGLPSDVVTSRMQGALAAVGLMGLERRSTSSLSGGQKQRLVTASALALEPKLVLLDESTSALDPRGARELYALLREKARERNLTVVAIERDLELLMDYADRVVALDSGRIVMDARRDDVARNSSILKRIGVRLPAWIEVVEALGARGLLSAPLPAMESEARRCLAELAAGTLTERESPQGELSRRMSLPRESALIHIEGLFARAGSFEILKGINLDIEAGEFVALLGPNGAGKTTLIKHFNGLRAPSAGTVIVDGMNTRQVKTSRLARSVGFLFQNPDHQIISNRVDDEIAFGLKQTGIPEPERGERVREAAATLGLSTLLDADPFTLSRALRQRVALASVLALKPKVLVLDEPTSSQDERGATRVMDVARELNAGGTTVILVSHDMELVARYARRAIVLVDGRVLADRGVHALFRDMQLLDAAGLSMPGAYRLAAALGIEPKEGRQFVPASVVEALIPRLPEACMREPDGCVL